jgi:hypothetical protein
MILLGGWAGLTIPHLKNISMLRNVTQGLRFVRFLEITICRGLTTQLQPITITIVCFTQNQMMGKVQNSTNGG